MKNISNLKPLLVVDVGTDSTKYSQCNLNTYMVSNVLRSKLNEKNISKTSQGNILLNSILNKHEETPVNNTSNLLIILLKYNKTNKKILHS